MQLLRSVEPVSFFFFFFFFNDTATTEIYTLSLHDALPISIFVMSSVKTTPLAGARPSTRFTLKIAFSTTPPRECIVAVTKSTASRARSKLLTLNSDISQLPSPRNRAMAGWSAGYQAARVRCQLTRGLISSLPGTAGLPPCISFSTSYPELHSAVLRHTDNERFVGNSYLTGLRKVGS